MPWKLNIPIITDKKLINEKLLKLLAAKKDIPNGVKPFITEVLDMKKPNIPIRIPALSNVIFLLRDLF